MIILVFWFFSFLLLVFCVWTLYNIPIVVVGARNLLRRRKRQIGSSSFSVESMPTVSIIVPVRNEEKVVGRVLQALLNLEYPSDRKEIIVVNDGSDDKTLEICNQFASGNPEVRIFTRSSATTKAAALNFGVRHAKGEIIATFDADSVPEPDALLNAIRYFENPAVASVQGRICSINARQNMLTKFLFYEGAVQYELYLRGKDQLDLFVGLGGTCQFVRRSALAQVGGWNEDCLSEDTELSLRLIEQDFVIRYAPEIRTWEESPFTVRGLVKQRARWYRGNIEMAAKFGRLLKRPSLRRFDAEMTLFGTFIILFSIANYFMAFCSFSGPPNFTLAVIAEVTSILTMVILGCAGVVLAFMVKPLRIRNVLWLPFIYAYWGFQSLIAFYALLEIVLRRPRTWGKTSRSGIVTAEMARDVINDQLVSE